MKGLCVVKDAYTTSVGDDPYIVERFYAEEFDRKYNDVYRSIVTPGTKLTEDQLFFIAVWIVSVTQRSTMQADYLLDAQMARVKQEYMAVQMGKQDTHHLKEIFEGRRFEEMEPLLRKENRGYMSVHNAQRIEPIARQKMKDSFLDVVRLKGEARFITSDNPLIISRPEPPETDPIFSSFTLILDPKTAITMRAKGGQGFDSHILHELNVPINREQTFVYRMNLSLALQANRYLLGESKTPST